jgi:hypothetical protein
LRLSAWRRRYRSKPGIARDEEQEKSDKERDGKKRPPKVEKCAPRTENRGNEKKGIRGGGGGGGGGGGVRVRGERKV